MRRLAEKLCRPARLAGGEFIQLERGWNCSRRHGGAPSPPGTAAPSFTFPSRPGCGYRSRRSRWHGQQESPSGKPSRAVPGGKRSPRCAAEPRAPPCSHGQAWAGLCLPPCPAVSRISEILLLPWECESARTSLPPRMRRGGRAEECCQVF